MGGLEHGSLWASATNGTKVKMHVPCLLCLPLLFVKLLCNQKKALMPHEVWQVVKNFSELQGLAQDCVDACKFIMDWCVLAPKLRPRTKTRSLRLGLIR